MFKEKLNQNSSQSELASILRIPEGKIISAVRTAVKENHERPDSYREDSKPFKDMIISKLADGKLTPRQYAVLLDKINTVIKKMEKERQKMILHSATLAQLQEKRREGEIPDDGSELDLEKE